MGEPARRKANYLDVLNAPDHLVAEVMDGELYTHPRPSPSHGTTATLIGVDVGPVIHRRGQNGGGEGRRWRIIFEPELHLGDDIVVPDIAGWYFERLPRLPAEAYIAIPPNWICEVLSPRTARIDRTTKKRIYARNQVEYLWLVDPVVQTLEVLQLAGEFWQEIAVHAANERVHVAPFSELELDLGSWWEEEAPD